MGFCLFNSVAIGALTRACDTRTKTDFCCRFRCPPRKRNAGYFLLRSGSVLRIHASVALTPEPDRRAKTGIEHNVVNRPLPAGIFGERYSAMHSRREYCRPVGIQPGVCDHSAGFDAHRADPLAQLQLDEDDFAWATEAVCRSQNCCGGRVVSALEGGYDLAATARSARSHSARPDSGRIGDIE